MHYCCCIYAQCDVDAAKMRVTFQLHIRFARKVQKYGDAFSKSFSIDGLNYKFLRLHQVLKNIYCLNIF